MTKIDILPLISILFCNFNGISETSLDCSIEPSETLVGSGVWQGSQSEVVAIESVDLCEFGGYLLGGYQVYNDIIIKVFVYDEQTEYFAIPTYSIGENVWGQPLYVIDNLELVPESEFFIELDILVFEYALLLHICL